MGVDPGALDSQLARECPRINHAAGDGRSSLASDQLDNAARERLNERLVKTDTGRWRGAREGLRLCAVSHWG